MPDQPLQTFEQKLARIEQIVKELEGGTTELALATQLFKEGKMLLTECDALLKTAEVQIKDIDRALDDSVSAGKSNDRPENEIPF